MSLSSLRGLGAVAVVLMAVGALGYTYLLSRDYKSQRPAGTVSPYSVAPTPEIVRRADAQKSQDIRISKLIVYPVKSCKGIEVTSQLVGPRGFDRDRRWMIVRKESGNFLTQRAVPKMALITPSFDAADLLVLSTPNQPSVTVPDVSSKETDCEVEIWKLKVRAVDCGDAVAAWLSSFIEIEVRLVYATDQLDRGIERDFVEDLLAPNQDTAAVFPVSFVDAYPFLVTSEESMEWINSQDIAKDEALSIKRFRPNIVVTGVGAPFSEEEWGVITVQRDDAQTLDLNCVKPCIRCAVPNVNQETGESDKKLNVWLRANHSLELKNGEQGPVFGVNAVYDISKQGFQISVGDSLSIKSKQPPPRKVENAQ